METPKIIRTGGYDPALGRGNHDPTLEQPAPAEITLTRDTVVHPNGYRLEIRGPVASSAISDTMKALDAGAEYAKASLLSRLSPRELETFVRLAVGRSCREIATDLGISHKTIDTHRQKVLSKLELDGNVDIARTALLLELVTLYNDDPTAAYYAALDAAHGRVREHQASGFGQRKPA